MLVPEQGRPTVPNPRLSVADESGCVTRTCRSPTRFWVGPETQHFAGPVSTTTRHLERALGVALESRAPRNEALSWLTPPPHHHKWRSRVPDSSKNRREEASSCAVIRRQVVTAAWLGTVGARPGFAQEPCCRNRRGKLHRSQQSSKHPSQEVTWVDGSCSCCGKRTHTVALKLRSVP